MKWEQRWQTEQMAKLQQAAEAKAPAVAQAAVDFAGMSASGNGFGCIALEGGIVPNFDDMTVRGGNDMAFCAQASLGKDLVMKGAHKDEKEVTGGTHSFVNLAPTKIAMEPLGGTNSSDTPNIAMEQQAVLPVCSRAQGAGPVPRLVLQHHHHQRCVFALH